VRRSPGFLRDPGACRVVLLYGDDAGLIRFRADALVEAVIGRLDDPFRVTELGREAATGLPAVAASLPLAGSRPVVRVRDATDAITDAVKMVLAGPGEALIVLEGINLPTRSRLRTLLEGTEAGAAIGCYPAGGRDLERFVLETAAEFGISIGAEALHWTCSQVEGDHGQVHREVEKLALYAGKGGMVDLLTAQACLSAVRNLSLDDALFAATEGDLTRCDRALTAAMEDGQGAASALRAALLHIQRLLRTSQLIDGGYSPERALSAVRPPVFWHRQISLRRALDCWQTPTLAHVLDALSDAERRCKQTGAPAQAICRQALMGIAGQAAGTRRIADQPPRSRVITLSS